MTTLKILSKNRIILKKSSSSSQSIPPTLDGGCYHRLTHISTSTRTDMTFGLFLPSSWRQPSTNKRTSTVPVMFWLSGLTCDDTNFANKAGAVAFRAAEDQDIAIVIPDTSPRGPDVPDVDSYDLGIGAGFYVDATRPPYDKHYQMRSYITKELPLLLANDPMFSSGNEGGIGNYGLRSISGHSMGGHGALTIALRSSGEKGKEGEVEWASVSAFSPICNPINCPWGKKAFDAYLGGGDDGNSSNDTWREYDAVQLLLDRYHGKREKANEAGDDTTTCHHHDVILIDQGTNDQFLLDGQLRTQSMVEAAATVAPTTGDSTRVKINMREGFDHSYHFIAAFIGDHVEFHGTRLAKRKQEILSG